MLDTGGTCPDTWESVCVRTPADCAAPALCPVRQATRARTKERAQLRAKPAGAPVQHQMQQPSYNYLCTAKIAQCIISQKNLHYFECVAFSDIKYRKVTSTSRLVLNHMQAFSDCL